MKRLLFLAFVFVQHVYGAELHVCAVANHLGGKMRQFLASCKKNRIHVDILGQNKPYYHLLRFQLMDEYLKALPDEDVVLFVDAFDVLILQKPNVILDKFIKTNCPFILSTEKNCFPFPEIANLLPESPTPFKYINAGGYIGYVHFLKKWIAHLKDTDRKCDCDQGQMSLDYFENPDFYYDSLDFHCDFFLCLHSVCEGELIVDQKSHTLYCKTTDSYPCIVHANGQSFDLWPMIYRRLIVH